MATIYYVTERGKYRAQTWNARLKKRGPSQMFEHHHQAEDWADGIERDMDRSARENGFDPGRAPARVTFKAYAESWQPDAPPSTARNYRSAARQLAKIWPTENVDAVTRRDVEAALYSMRNLAPQTRTSRLTVMRQIFRAAIVDGLRADDPTVNVKGPKVRRDSGKRRPMSDAELDRILSHLAPWMRTAALIARDSGLRIGEVAGLRWFRLDFNRSAVVVADVVLSDGTFRDTPKNGIPATVPLTPRTIAALRELADATPGHKPGDRVFRYDGRGGARFATPSMIRRYWKAAVKAAGIDPAPRFHDLRHSLGQALADAEVPREVIQEYMRHESPEITATYTGRVPLAQMARWSAVAAGRPPLALVSA